MIDVFPQTIETALAGMRKGDFSARELALSCLENVRKYNPKYKALLSLEDEKKILGQAAEIEAQGYDKPLAGIPIVAKDLFSTQDLVTTAGAKIINNYRPVYSATVIEKLKKAGAIILAKANQDAWGHGSSGENSDYEPARNPYDSNRVPGGSSSGSAVAVATGMCLAATGTDTGSSVRLPAAFCNLVGLKPTYGRVSRYGIIAMASSFDTIGHLTKTVADNALICQVTAGKDPFDATTTALTTPEYAGRLGHGIRGIKIGFPKEYLNLEGIQESVRELTRKSFEQLEKLGAHVVEISLPHTDYAMASYYILVPSEVSSNLSRFDGIRYGHDRSIFGAEAKRRIMIGTYALSSGYYDAYYAHAAKARTLIKADFEEVFKTVDVVAAPASPNIPFRIGEKTQDPVAMYLSDIFMCPVNIAGVPALSVPCGFAENLPVGLQIIGSHFSEEIIYSVAAAYENETQFYKKHPVL